MMMRPLITTVACALAYAPLPAQQVGIDQTEKQLAKLFERPAGQPISNEQKTALADFLRAHEGKLGRLGYARGLHSYLTRDYEKATDQLDSFFAKYDAIGIDEHRLMAGRIYMSALMRLARTKDPTRETLTRYAERATRLYADMSLLARYMPRALDSLEDEDTVAAVRVALARGAVRSNAPTAAQDAFLKAIYGGAVPARAAVPATRVRPSRAPTGEAAKRRAAAEAKRNALHGKTAPKLSPDVVLNGEPGLPVAAAKDKVVLVDFWATWCGPCRAVIPDLVEIQKKHGSSLQVIGATRFYTYGSDFSAPNAKPPHGGAKTVRNLDRKAEIDINLTFSRVFDLNYPIVFVDKTVFETYGVTGIPTVFVIGMDGKVHGHVVGGGKANHDKLIGLIKTALGSR